MKAKKVKPKYSPKEIAERMKFYSRKTSIESPKHKKAKHRPSWADDA